MQKGEIKNVLVQALIPSRFPVMLKKLQKRLVDDKGLLSKHENLEWIQSHCSRFETLANQLDPTLWEEAARFSIRLESYAKRILRNLEHNLGGGGAFPFLYFLTRYTKPNCIVETGVAAGFSTCAFLSAINANGRGRLYSSDFPYLRLPNPERFIGVLVKRSHKRNWKLYVDGDEKNLPKILIKVDQVDIFHYDSDKSYSGRKAAVSVVESKMSKNGIILLDDIQDNSHFHDYVMTKGVPSWCIFMFKKKYVGMIGELSRRAT